MPLPGRPGRPASSVIAISIIPWVGARSILDYLVDRNIQGIPLQSAFTFTPLFVNKENVCLDAKMRAVSKDTLNR